MHVWGKPPGQLFIMELLNWFASMQVKGQIYEAIC